MSLKSGFYNAVEVETGVYDRSYSADEYTNFYSAFLKDGVRRSGLNDFVCSASGLVVTVGEGYAVAGSKWIHNDAPATLETITPPTGSYSRIDGVFLRVDTNEETRAASLVYRTGTPAATPEPPAKSSDSGIYELCLCYVTVAPNATTVSITDKRGDASVCGWVTTPVGYDDYFEQFETEFAGFLAAETTAFETWFENVRTTLASTTLFKQYTQYLKTTGSSTEDVTITIPQYDPSGVDIVQVYCNGMLLFPNVDYTISSTTVHFQQPKILNTEILIVVYKSIDGAGLGSVSDEITTLQRQVAQLQQRVTSLSTKVITDSFTYQPNIQIPIRTQIQKSIPIYKSGYTAVGIVDVLFNYGDDHDNVAISKFYITDGSSENAKANIGIVNTGSSTETVRALTITVLYIKL